MNQERFIPNFNPSLTGTTKNQKVWMVSLRSIGKDIGKIFIPQVLSIKSRHNMINSLKLNFWLMVPLPNAVLDQKQWNHLMFQCIITMNCGWYIIYSISTKLKLWQTLETWLKSPTWNWVNSSQKVRHILLLNKKLVTWHHKIWLKTQPIKD